HCRLRAVAAAAIAAAGEDLARKTDGPQRPRRRRTPPLVVAAAEPAITYPLAPISHRSAVLPALAAFCAVLLASCGGSDNATPASAAAPAARSKVPSCRRDVASRRNFRRARPAAWSSSKGATTPSRRKPRTPRQRAPRA